MREKNQKDELIWQCRISSRYHGYRESFLYSWHRVVFCTIFISSVSLPSGLFFDIPTEIVAIIALLPVTSVSLDLILKLSIGAKTHNFLKKRFYHLEVRLTGNKISDITLDEVEKEVVQLMADEPLGYRVLLYHCNNLVDIEYGKEPRLQISKWKMLLKNVLRFTGTSPQKIKKQKKLTLLHRFWRGVYGILWCIFALAVFVVLLEILPY